MPYGANHRLLLLVGFLYVCAAVSLVVDGRKVGWLVLVGVDVQVAQLVALRALTRNNTRNSGYDPCHPVNSAAVGTFSASSLSSSSPLSTGVLSVFSRRGNG